VPAEKGSGERETGPTDRFSTICQAPGGTVSRERDESFRDFRGFGRRAFDILREFGFPRLLVPAYIGIVGAAE
jgi:hypothetical protein